MMHCSAQRQGTTGRRGGHPRATDMPLSRSRPPGWLKTVGIAGRHPSRMYSQPGKQPKTLKGEGPKPESGAAQSCKSAPHILQGYIRSSSGTADVLQWSRAPAKGGGMTPGPQNYKDGPGQPRTSLSEGEDKVRASRQWAQTRLQHRDLYKRPGTAYLTYLLCSTLAAHNKAQLAATPPTLHCAFANS